MRQKSTSRITSTLLAVVLALSVTPVRAAFLDITEGAEGSPVSFSTNLVGSNLIGPPTVVEQTAERFQILGYLHAGNALTTMPTGKRMMVLTEPGGNAISDIIAVEALEAVDCFVGAVCQQVGVTFISDTEGQSLDGLVQELQSAGYAYTGSLLETGELQDVSALLQTVEVAIGQASSPGLFLRVQSDAVETAVPEPGTVVLLGIGMLGLGLARRRQHP